MTSEKSAELTGNILIGILFVVLLMIVGEWSYNKGQKNVLNDCAKNGVVVIDDGALRCMPIIFEGRING